MVLGFIVTPIMLLNGGLLLFALMVFQMLQGMRKIKFKGPLHLKVHKRMAWVIMAFALVHGTMATIYVFGVRIG